MRHIAALAVASALLFPAALAAQQPFVPSTLLDYRPRAQADVAATAAVESSGVPSASLSIVKDGRIVYDHAYGYSHLEPNVSAAPGMRYSIGSVSKQFTAIALLQLQQQGKLSMSDPVGKWLPDLTRGKEVTIRQVLSHTSGYQDFWPEDYVMTTMMQPTNADHILDVWGRKPLDFEPGTQWQYSNTNYVIAGRIAEMVSGEPIFTYLQEHIFAPLGMQSVLNQDARRLTQTDALGYYRHALGPLRPAPEEGFGWMFAAGELAMTAHDLSLWNIAVMSQDPRILNADGWKQLSTEVMLKSGAPSHYGLGVFVLEQAGHRIIEHSGEVSGFVSEQVIWPDDHASIVVLTNLDASGGASAVARGIRKAVFPELGPKPKPPAAAPPAQTNTPPAENAPDATTLQARGIFEALQHGQLDRSQLTKLASDYFTPEAIADFQQSLAALGKPVSFTETAHELRGGMTFHAYEAKFADGRTVEITTYIEPDGKIEQYLVSAR